FFQAEDGIRDFHVTGVQTCALPISGELLSATRAAPGKEVAVAQIPSPAHPDGDIGLLKAAPDAFDLKFEPSPMESGAHGGPDRKIGRASCREGVQVEGGGGTMNV